jgi:hypothetical protein
MEIEFNEGGPFGEMLSGAIRGAMCNRVLFVRPIIRGWGRGEEEEEGTSMLVRWLSVSASQIKERACAYVAFNLWMGGSEKNCEGSKRVEYGVRIEEYLSFYRKYED